MMFALNQTAIGFMLKLPMIMLMGSAILLGLVFKETVDKSKNMGQGEAKMGANTKGFAAVIVLFILTIPGGLQPAEHILNVIGNGIFMLYALACIALLVMYGRALGKMIHGSGGEKMIKTAKTIMFQVKLLSTVAFNIIFAILFNMFRQVTVWDHQIFWYWLHLAEWGAPMVITYSLRQTKGKKNPNVKTSTVAPATTVSK